MKCNCEQAKRNNNGVLDDKAKAECTKIKNLNHELAAKHFDPLIEAAEGEWHRIDKNIKDGTWGNSSLHFVWLQDAKEKAQKVHSDQEKALQDVGATWLTHKYM